MPKKTDRKEEKDIDSFLFGLADKSDSSLRLFCIKSACLLVGFGIGAIPYAIDKGEGLHFLDPWILLSVLPMVFGVILLTYGERNL